MKPDAKADFFIVGEADWTTISAVYTELGVDPPKPDTALGRLNTELGMGMTDSDYGAVLDEFKLSRAAVSTLADFLMGRRSDPDAPPLLGDLEGWELRAQLRNTRAGRYVIAQSTES